MRTKRVRTVVATALLAAGGLGSGAGVAQAQPVPVPAGAAAVSVQTVTSGDITVAAGSPGYASLDCPAGTVALGGGASNTGSGDLALSRSYPGSSSSVQDWDVAVFNKSSAPVSFRAYVRCGTGFTGVYGSLSSPVFPAPNGGRATVEATCRTGDLVLGGGHFVSGLLNVAVDDSLPPTGGSSWAVDIRNDNNAEIAVQADTVCGKGPVDLRVIASDPVTLNPGGYASATARCPAGLTALSGGSGSFGGAPYGVSTSNSYPSGNDGWTVSAKAHPSAGEVLRAHVICGS